MVSAVGTVAQSWVLGQVVDKAVTPRFETGQLRAGAAVAAACAILAVGVVKTAGIITRRIAATIVHANVQATLRDRLAERYHRLPLTWHHEHPAGELLSGPRATWTPPPRSSPLPFATGGDHAGRGRGLAVPGRPVPGHPWHARGPGHRGPQPGLPAPGGAPHHPRPGAPGRHVGGGPRELRRRPGGQGPPGRGGRAGASPTRPSCCATPASRPPGSRPSRPASTPCRP